jgi:hypothetical protein
MTKTLVSGSCVIFSGLRKLTYEEQSNEFYYEDYKGGDKWIVESDELTKNRLILSLLSVNIVCEINDIVIDWIDYDNGTKLCKFYYKKSLNNEVLEDIYINRLLGFDCITDLKMKIL